MTLHGSSVVGAIAWVFAVLVGLAGVARHAFANDANCERTVTRTWDPVAGNWVYWDSGCVQTNCAPGNPCKQHASGPNAVVCGCTDSPQISRPCVKRVVYPGPTPTGAACINGNCSNPCDTIWTPIHGSPQALTCPCP